MKPVTVLGDLVVDYVLRIDHFPVNIGGHQSIREMVHEPGGAANTLIMGARLGLPMQTLAVIGDDDAGNLLKGLLISEGVNVKNVVIDAGAITPVIFTLVGKNGEHVFLGYQKKHSVNTILSARWRDLIKQSSALFLDGWTYETLSPAITLEAVDAAYQANVPVFFDPGPEFPRFSSDWLMNILTRTTGLLLTEEEARGILGIKNNISVEIAAERLLKMGAKLVLIKLGRKGCFLYDGERKAYHEGFSVSVIDTSGAGDVVAAVMLFSFLVNFDLHDACVLMNAAGAVTAGKLGAGTQVAKIDEIKQLLKLNGFQELSHKLDFL